MKIFNCINIKINGKSLRNIFIIIVFIFAFNFCGNKILEPEFDPIKVNVRMEVQVLDSTYHLYKRPFTQIYFTTYKLTSNNNKVDFSQSDTTSCPNGWGVKQLKYTLNNMDEKIILAASNENYNGANYREIEIDYNELEYRIDSLKNADITKTFAIYYK